jgi:hypothetical protein
VAAYPKDDPSSSTHYDWMTLHAARDTGGQYSPLDTAACVNNMAVKNETPTPGFSCSLLISKASLCLDSLLVLSLVL